MITLRMLGIALAILVAIPITFALADHAVGHVQVPGGELVDASEDFVVTVTDIVLADLPTPVDRAVVHNAPEQLVEGHTVFVTWDIKLTPNVTNWSENIMGDIDCQVNQSMSGYYSVGGIPVPRKIDELHLECHAAGKVIVTPDPFYDSDNTYQTEMQPTGNMIPFTAPNGVAGVAEELSYIVIETNWLGEQKAHTLYAWRVPVLPPWTHIDGTTKQWYCPIPGSRIQEMGIDRYTAYHEGDVYAFDAVLATS